MCNHYQKIIVNFQKAIKDSNVTIVNQIFNP
jgi:hypothetical protein